MAYAFLLLNVFIVLLGTLTRFRREGLEHAGPISMTPQMWWILIGAAGIGSLVAAALGRRRLPKGWRRPAVELAVCFPSMFVVIWFIIRARTSERLWTGWALLLGLVVLAAGLLFADRRRYRQWGVTLKDVGPACRLLAIPTVIMKNQNTGAV